MGDVQVRRLCQLAWHGLPDLRLVHGAAHGDSDQLDADGII
jgi:hypothetical protein